MTSKTKIAWIDLEGKTEITSTPIQTYSLK